MRRNQRQQQQQQQQQQNRYRPPQRRFPSTQNRPATKNLQPSRQARLRNRLRSLKCTNCSKWAKTAKFHEGPYGGGIESKCPFDRYGNKRQGFKFLNKIGGEYICNIDLEEDENDLEYESDNENDHECNHDSQNSLNHFAESNSFPF